MRTQMNGYIVADEDAWIYRWFGYQVCAPQDIRRALADNPPGETLTVEINNVGGSMFSGFEIYSVLQGAQCPTEAEIQSLAASAASVAMLGCQRVKATPVAQVMIHNPSLPANGDQNVHYKTAEDLEKFAQSLLNAYEIKCRGKRSREELASMLDAETWMTVQEAAEAGLVDEIIGGGEIVPGSCNGPIEGPCTIESCIGARCPDCRIYTQVMNAVGGGLRALSGTGGLPSAAELRAKKAAMDSATATSVGPPPAGLALKAPQSGASRSGRAELNRAHPLDAGVARSMESGAGPVDDPPEETGAQARLAASLSLKKYY